MSGIDPTVYSHRIYIKDDCCPLRQPQRRVNPALKEIVKEELQKLLKAGFIYPIFDSQWVSPLVIVPKKGGKWRVCVDYRALNLATRNDHFPLPFVDQVLDSLASKRYFSFLDGFSGYNQIQIALEDQEKTTFTFPWGTYAYYVLPFGLCNAPATFQRAVISIFSDISQDIMEIYMDDFTTYGSEFDQALGNLKKVLQRCEDYNLSLNNEKCFIMMEEGIVLGHHISVKGIKVDPTKIEVIQYINDPIKQKDVRSFLGHAGYYRRFIKDFSKIASPLYSLLTKDAKFKWTPVCNEAFSKLKHALTQALVLKGPNWSLPFQIHTDASDYAIGVVLGQKVDKLEKEIYYIDKNLQGPELNYIVTEKEMLAVIYALIKFRHYIIGYPIFVHTDHTAIRYLMNKPSITDRLARWLLLMQEFDIIVVDKPMNSNVVANYLSCLQLQEDSTMIDDTFSDEHLFLIQAHTPWYADIANYLAAAKMPISFSPKERRLLVEKSFNFSWISDCLFYTRPDQVMRRCVKEDETYDILHACHDEPCGGHFAAKRTTLKILNT
ncbi:hypothetical protein SUGI_0348760 [Cryptomeria japonica]|nr:hypothetical protein SUGI_0348760 [Cryptomeria japonica]